MASIRSRRLSRSLAFLSAALFLLAMLGSQSALALTIFGAGPRPETADIPIIDPTDYELGTFFSSSVAGQVTALRVYLGPVEAASPGTITGTLWDAYGSVLATEVFGSIVAGWNEVTLTTPIGIAASTTYVVSANTNAGTNGTGSYADDKGPGDLGFFGGGGYVNAPLTATSGVFNTTPGAFPTSNYPASNGGSSYFRDVQFTPIPEPSTALLVGVGIAVLSLRPGRRSA